MGSVSYKLLEYYDRKVCVRYKHHTVVMTRKKFMGIISNYFESVWIHPDCCIVVCDNTFFQLWLEEA